MRCGSELCTLACVLEWLEEKDLEINALVIVIILCLSDSYFSSFFFVRRLGSQSTANRDCIWLMLLHSNVYGWDIGHVVVWCLFVCSTPKLVRSCKYFSFVLFFVFKFVVVVRRLRRQLAAVHRICINIPPLNEPISYVSLCLSHFVSSSFKFFIFYFPIAFEQILFLDIREINKYAR